LPGEFTSGPQVERSGGAAGAAFFAYFLSLQTESRWGVGGDAPGTEALAESGRRTVAVFGGAPA
jgi:hypothetical protein